MQTAHDSEYGTAKWLGSQLDTRIRLHWQRHVHPCLESQPHQTACQHADDTGSSL